MSLSNASPKGSVAVIGLGYVGLPLAILAASKGYRVIGIDINKEKVNLIRQNKPPFADELLAQDLAHIPLEATTDFQRVKKAFVVVICVPTPVYSNHVPDLRPVESACKGIGPFLQKGQLIILESTVNPGVSETIVLPLLEQLSRLKGGRDFYLAHCPERINPGDPKWNVVNIPRVVGGLEEKSLQKAVEFYNSIIKVEVKPMHSLKEAEAVKIVENSFRDINIAFVNELAMSFSRLGVDIVEVIKGAATKPFAFMPHYPGCGVGGHCIPVDPYYLIEYAKTRGFEHDFLSLARRINNRMPAFTAELAAKALNERKIAINGAKIAVLGLAYKANVDDDRESPAYEVIKHLQEYGAQVVAYDPYLPKKSIAHSLDESLRGAQAAVITTAHQEFVNLSPQYFLECGVKVVVDGRNCLAKQEFLAAGITYKGIGR